MNSVTKTVPVLLLLALTAKITISGAGMPEAVIIACLSVLIIAAHSIEYIITQNHTQEQLSAFREELKSHKELLGLQEEKTKEAISYVSNLKLKNVVLGGR